MKALGVPVKTGKVSQKVVPIAIRLSGHPVGVIRNDRVGISLGQPQQMSTGLRQLFVQAQHIVPL